MLLTVYLEGHPDEQISHETGCLVSVTVQSVDTSVSEQMRTVPGPVHSGAELFLFDLVGLNSMLHLIKLYCFVQKGLQIVG